MRVTTMMRDHVRDLVMKKAELEELIESTEVEL
jgi:hypothetical protein